MHLVVEEDPLGHVRAYDDASDAAQVWPERRVPGDRQTVRRAVPSRPGLNDHTRCPSKSTSRGSTMPRGRIDAPLVHAYLLAHQHPLIP